MKKDHSKTATDIKKEEVVSQSLQSTAYHEAGHAVVAISREWPVRIVTIIPDKQDGSFGHVLKKKIRAFKDIYADKTSPTIEKRINDSIIISYAGGIAQRKFNGKGYRRYHVSSDSDNVIELAYMNYGDSKTRSAYLKWLYLVSQRLVEAYWKSIIAVANELLRCKTLDSRALRQIIYPPVDISIINSYRSARTSTGAGNR